MYYTQVHVVNVVTNTSCCSNEMHLLLGADEYLVFCVVNFRHLQYLYAINDSLNELLVILLAPNM